MCLQHSPESVSYLSLQAFVVRECMLIEPAMAHIHRLLPVARVAVLFCPRVLAVGGSVGRSVGQSVARSLTHSLTLVQADI